MDVGGCPLRRGGANIFGNMRLIDGKGDRAPNGVDGLALRRGTVESNSLLS